MSVTLKMTQEEVYQGLLMLSKMHVLHYVPRRTCPYILYSTSREEDKYLIIPKTVYEDRIEQMTKRIDSIKRFAFAQDQCRVQIMLDYFGQKDIKPCGQCDYCRTVKQIKGDTKTTVIAESDLLEHIKTVLETVGTITLQNLLKTFGTVSENQRKTIIEGVRKLADDDKIKIDGINVTMK